jgi:hypothetical protein
MHRPAFANVKHETWNLRFRRPIVQAFPSTSQPSHREICGKSPNSFPHNNLHRSPSQTAPKEIGKGKPAATAQLH